MAFCEGCGSLLEEDARFCSACGRKAPEENKAPDPEKENTAAPTPTVFCTNCGASIQADSAFCEQCGTPLGSTSSRIDDEEDIPLPSTEEVDAAVVALEGELSEMIKEVLEYNLDAPRDLGESVIARWKG